MRNVACVSSDQSSIYSHLNDHRRSLFCNAINDFMMSYFFISSFITFRTKVRMSIIPSPSSFFFALSLEWSLDLSTDKK